MRREKPPGRQKGARLFSMLLAVCLMIAALPLSVSAAGEYIYGDWKVTKEATETEEGSRERGCAVCEYVQTEAIPAAGTGEPTDSTDPTDSSDSQGQQDPSGDTGSPQTGDSSDMALWISLMLASCGGVLGMLLYRRKKAAAEK